MTFVAIGALGLDVTFNIFQSYHATLNTFLACGDFCSLLITFVISLDLDQDRHSRY